MEETLDARLLTAGLDRAQAVGLDETIRPNDPEARTVAAPSQVTLPEELPILSIDLRSAAAPEPVRSDLQIVRVLGEGGMGRVYLVRQHSLAREVAVKTVKEGTSEQARNALLAEGAVTGRLEHPGIVPVHALGLDGAGRPVLVMKRIEGVSWRELLEDPSHPGWEGWEGSARDRLPGHLQILIAICNAVHFAHSRGVVHRDIKPENVLIGRFGDVYLADWGVAGKIGEPAGALCGTPMYMAPEMVAGGTIDARSDVYLLGATLHHVLAGEPRHRGDTLVVVLASASVSEPHVYGESVPRELAELANAACARDPNDRPASAQAFRDAMVRYLRHRDSVALGAEALERFEKLRALTAIETPDDDQRRAIDRLTAEVRFALEQALRQWEDNPRARTALEELEALLEARRARTAELEREAQERDPRQGRVARAIGMSIFSLVGVAISAFALTSDEAPGPWMLVLYPAFMAVGLSAFAIAMRRRVLTTAFNRGMTLMLFIMIMVMLLGRVLGLFVPIRIEEHFLRDSFLSGASLLVSATAYFRWLAWIGAIFLAGGVLIAFFPSAALQIFAVAAAVAIILGAAFAWRGEPPRSR